MNFKILRLLIRATILSITLLGLAACVGEPKPVYNLDVACPYGFYVAFQKKGVSTFCVTGGGSISDFERDTSYCPNGLAFGDTFCLMPHHLCAWGLETEECKAVCANSPAIDNNNPYHNIFCDNLAASSSSSSSISSSSSSSADLNISIVASSSQSSQASSLENYFAAKPCGVDYDAMGNGSWQACFTLDDGTAGCIHKENNTQLVPVKWNDGEPVANAAQISGAGYYDVILVTTDGKVYFGDRSSLDKNAPLIPSGGISGTGGQNTRCAIIEENGKKDVRCWSGNSDPYRPELPSTFNAMQLSANYSDVCALNDDGRVWCWQQKADNSLDFIAATPSIAPFSEPLIFLSVGQLSICGVKLSGGIECLARWDSTNHLPTKGDATNIPVDQSGMEDGVAFQAGFNQGVSIHKIGDARFWKDGSSTAFTGITNAVAAGGDRDVACVLTSDGDVYCLDSNKQPVKITADKKAKAGACAL